MGNRHLGARRARTARTMSRPFLMEALEGRALLATFTVSNLNDAGPGSLRGAIELANADPDRDTIAFDSGLSGTITLTSALPALSNLDLNGPSANLLTVARSGAQGAPAFRIVNVPENVDVSLSGLTLSGGRSPDGDILGGGGVLNSGMLTLSGVGIVGNTSTGDSGGIANLGTLTITDSVIADNVSRGPGDRNGGGISNLDLAELTIRDSTIRNNAAIGEPIGPLGTRRRRRNLQPGHAFDRQQHPQRQRRQREPYVPGSHRTRGSDRQPGDAFDRQQHPQRQPGEPAGGRRRDRQFRGCDDRQQHLQRQRDRATRAHVAANRIKPFR